VVAGLGRLLAQLPGFRFDEAALEFLAARGVIDAATCDWLSEYRFRGSIDAYGEGEVYFPSSPVLTVEGSFADCVVLETLVLSILNHDSAVATAAARMVGAAGSRPCIEMGSRRTHEQAAVASARAAYIAGFTATSNLAAGFDWAVPTVGTAAHAFTLVHDDERTAFAAQVETLGPDTTLLVDTYDVTEGIRTAVEVAGASLGAIRLDSGDLLQQAHDARRLLDELGAHDTRIVVTSDLDEFAIAALASAPVDGYGIGTSVATGSRVPTAGFVYKLVEYCDESGQPHSAEKRSAGKKSTGGRKYAVRRRDARRIATEERIGVHGRPERRADDRDLQLPAVREGEVVLSEPVDAARERCRSAIAELPAEASKLSEGDPVIPTVLEVR
jgi:nicotinate phosphoribosyltransferase